MLVQIVKNKSFYFSKNLFSTYLDSYNTQCRLQTVVKHIIIFRLQSDGHLCLTEKKTEATLSLNSAFNAQKCKNIGIETEMFV